MKAMLLKGKNQPLVLDTVPDPVPGPGEAVARVLACGAGLTIHHVRAGRVPEHGYLGEIADFVAYGGMGSALMRDAPHNFMTRFLPALAPVSAFIAAREGLAKARVDDVNALARSLQSPRVLKSRMMGG